MSRAAHLRGRFEEMMAGVNGSRDDKTVARKEWGTGLGAAVAIGAGIGAAFGNPAVGVGVGVALGAALLAVSGRKPR